MVISDRRHFPSPAHLVRAKPATCLLFGRVSMYGNTAGAPAICAFELRGRCAMRSGQKSGRSCEDATDHLIAGICRPVSGPRILLRQQCCRPRRAPATQLYPKIAAVATSARSSGLPASKTVGSSNEERYDGAHVLACSGRTFLCFCAGVLSLRFIGIALFRNERRLIKERLIRQSSCASKVADECLSNSGHKKTSPCGPKKHSRQARWTGVVHKLMQRAAANEST